MSEEIQLTGGRGKVEWLAGVYYWDQKSRNRGMRWQVNEFQKGEMNPNNVFANAVCNPVASAAQGGGVAIELAPGSTTNYRMIPGIVDNTGRALGGAVVADNPATTAVNESLADVNAALAGQQTGINPRTGQLYLANGAAAWSTCQQIYFSNIGPAAFDSLSRSGQDGWALFGEATVHITDTLDLTLGIRQHDQSGFTVNAARALSTVLPARLSRRPSRSTRRSYPVGDPFAMARRHALPTRRSSSTSSRRAWRCRSSSTTTSWAMSATRKASTRVACRPPIIGGVRTLFPFKPATLKNTEIGMRADLADGKVRFNCDGVRHDLGRPPGRGRRDGPGHRRADSDAAHHERR